MYSSDYSELIRNRFMAEHNRLTTKQLPHPISFSINLQTSLGGRQIIVNGKELMPAVGESPTMTAPPVIPSITTVQQIFSALESLLVYIASISLPPTRSARISYLWFFTVASAYSWVTPEQAITGTKDSWNWDTKNVLSNNDDVFVWMTHVLVGVMNSFVPSYNTSELLSNEQIKFGWSSQQQTDEWNRISAAGNYSTWLSNWTTWFSSYRANDGSVAAAVAPSDSVLPNGSTRLNVSVSQDITAYANPRKWTPLTGIPPTPTSVKNFLTYGWADITSSCLTGSDETAIKSTASAFFLGTAPARDSEIDALVILTQALTDAQKVQAEFWAGGPTTVSPPCMMVWFWKKYIEITGKSLRTTLYSGLELSVNIFESSRLAWALKREHMEARPIQEIRRAYATQTLTKYDGTTFLGELWVPFQQANFVTPPFADFPSGHSTFSQSFANVMNAWFSSSIPTDSITMTNLNLLSPMFSGTFTNSLTAIRILAKTSKIETDVTPSADVTLSWTTWQEIADSAGVSRQYGGIHCVSAHQGGQSVANSIFPLVTSSWNISRV